MLIPLPRVYRTSVDSWQRDAYWAHWCHMGYFDIADPPQAVAGTVNFAFYLLTLGRIIPGNIIMCLCSLL